MAHPATAPSGPWCPACPVDGLAPPTRATRSLRNNTLEGTLSRVICRLLVCERGPFHRVAGSAAPRSRCSLSIVLRGGGSGSAGDCCARLQRLVGCEAARTKSPGPFASSETGEPAFVIYGLQFSSFDRRSVRPDRPTNRAGLLQELTRHLDRQITRARRAGLNLSVLTLVNDVPAHLSGPRARGFCRVQRHG